MGRFLIVWLCLTAFMLLSAGGALASDQRQRIVPPGPNEVHIAPNYLVVPLGRILLIRRGAEYGAVKFTKFWTGRTEQDTYASYESYYQGDKSGDLSKKNVQATKDELSFPKPRGIGRLAFSFGNKEVRCGPIRLFWTSNGTVAFYGMGQPEGDYGIELAPTKWTDIFQVNVFDPRVRWYKYDAERKRMNIPVDKLWQDANTRRQR